MHITTNIKSIDLDLFSSVISEYISIYNIDISYFNYSCFFKKNKIYSSSIFSCYLLNPVFFGIIYYIAEIITTTFFICKFSIQ